MNDKRTCQMLLIPYILFELSNDGDGVPTQRINNYITGLSRKIVDDRKRLFKISKRTFNCVKDIFKFIADGDKYSGYKVIRVSYYLTQMIFNDKLQYNLSEKDKWMLKKIYAVMDYALYHEYKNRYINLNSEKDFERLDKSAEKLAPKIFDKFYLNI